MPAAPRKFWQGSRWRKLALIIVLAPLVIELVYVIAVNGLLRSGRLGPLISESRVHIEIDSGWSLWPGRVHAGEIRFRFEDRNLQFYVILDDAVVDVNLWKLPTKVIHLTRIRGDGTRYLFRHKVESAAGRERRLERFVQIPGFAAIPLITDPKKPPLTDEEYNLWTVELSDVDVQVSELWFQEYRFLGKGRARGSFRLKPQRDAQTGHCQLDLNGNISSGPQRVLDDLVGKLEVQLHRHDPRQVKGIQIFGKFSVRADARGAVPNLAVSELYAKRGGVHLERGAGKVAINLDYENGEWVKGSQVRYETRDLKLRKGELSIAGASDISATIVRGGPHAHVRLSFGSPRVRLGLRGIPEGLERPFARQVHVALGATANLTRQKHWTALTADLGIVVPEARWLGSALDEPDRFRGGSIEAKLHADWSAPAPATAQVQVSMQQVTFGTFSDPIVLSGTLDAEASYDLEREQGQFGTFTLRLPNMSIADRSLPGGLQIRSERLEWQGLPPENTEGRFELTAADLAPLLPLAIPSRILRGLAKLFVRLGETRATFEVGHTPEATELRLIQGKSGNVSASGELRLEHAAPHPCGRWYIQAGPLRAGLLMSGGKNSVEPRVSPGWWRERPVGPHCYAMR